ncbi:CD276 antigen homolog isoform X2 [Channa argus]|uniref:CD276 antigen homolog isoform X2 n=1 Tax=Channa argus TaxID=215402 RepID=UPI00351FC981
METRLLSVFLNIFYCISDVFPLLHVSSGNIIINGTRGARILWRCHHTFSEPFQPEKSSIFWQGFKNSDIVLHFYKNGQEEFYHQHKSFHNRTTIFPDQLPLGNFSLIIEKLTLQDDQITVQVIFMSEGKPTEKLCQTTLYVAARFQEPKIKINQAEDMATCSTKGGYPKPDIKWRSGDGRTVLKPRVPPTVKPEEDGTYSVTSSANITRFNNVTCEVYNPTSKEILRTSYQQPPASNSPVAIVIISILIIIIILAVVMIVVRNRGDSSSQPDPVDKCPGQDTEV